MERAASAIEAASRFTSHSPRSRQGFIEIVDVEDDVAFRCGEAAEIHEVTIAACLYLEICVGHLRQVGGHHSGSSSIEGERRLQHPTVSDRHELLHSACVRFPQDIDRVWPALGLLPSTVLLSRNLVT